MKFTLLLTLLLLTACDVAQQARTDVFYKRDAIVKYAGKEYIGVAVLPKAALYDMEFQFAAPLDLFTFRTCHREVTQEEFKSKGGLFGGIFDRKTNRAGYKYAPQEGVEDNSYCPVEIGGFDATSGRHSWAFIDFEDGRDTLSAVVKCNGVRIPYQGVSVCQSSLGLVQDIVFPTAVEMTDVDCLKPETTNDTTFRLYMPQGRCVYVFREKAGERRYHRFTTLGYESILVRKPL